MAQIGDRVIGFIRVGSSNAVTIFGHLAARLGIPTVEVNGFENNQFLKPEQAEEIATALLHAAKIARGEIPGAP